MANLYVMNLSNEHRQHVFANKLTSAERVLLRQQVANRFGEVTYKITDVSKTTYQTMVEVVINKVKRHILLQGDV